MWPRSCSAQPGVDAQGPVRAKHCHRGRPRLCDTAGRRNDDARCTPALEREQARARSARGGRRLLQDPGLRAPPACRVHRRVGQRQRRHRRTYGRQGKGSIIARSPKDAAHDGMRQRRWRGVAWRATGIVDFVLPAAAHRPTPGRALALRLADPPGGSPRSRGCRPPPKSPNRLCRTSGACCEPVRATTCATQGATCYAASPAWTAAFHGPHTPCRTAEHKIEGAILNFFDVTELNAAEERLRLVTAPRGPSRSLRPTRPASRHGNKARNASSVTRRRCCASPCHAVHAQRPGAQRAAGRDAPHR
jgi:hypothetical protein